MHDFAEPLRCGTGFARARSRSGSVNPRVLKAPTRISSGGDTASQVPTRTSSSNSAVQHGELLVAFQFGATLGDLVSQFAATASLVNHLFSRGQDDGLARNLSVVLQANGCGNSVKRGDIVTLNLLVSCGCRQGIALEFKQRIAD